MLSALLFLVPVVSNSKLTKGENKFSYTLPSSKREITFKLLTQKDEKEIAKEVLAKEKLLKIHL